MAADEASARRAVAAAYEEIDRLEAMISSWRETSETSEINRQAGIAPVVASDELLHLIHRAGKISRLTDGAFDLSFAAFGRLWDFSSTSPVVPAEEDIRSALELVDFEDIVVDLEARTVFLRRPGMRIGLGAIGKGFAANRAVSRMKELGIRSGVVNAGGDLLAFGTREDGSPWTIGIADPKRRDEVFAYLRLRDQAVVTSGDYESFFEQDGVRYSHILDPRTGHPVRGVISATVVCPDAELADALATSISVLGVREGLQLIDRLKGVEALLVTDDGEIHFSRNLESSLSRHDNDPSSSATGS